MALIHVMREHPGGLLQSLCGRLIKSSWHPHCHTSASSLVIYSAPVTKLKLEHRCITMCPNRVSRRAWIIAMSFGRFVFLQITISDKVVPFDAQQHSKAPLRSYARLSWKPTSTLIHTGKLAGCTCYTALASL